MTLPIFIQSGSIGEATISTANTNRDGTGTITDLVGTSTSGVRIDRIEGVATGNTTAGMLRFFIHDGSAWRLWREVAVEAVTPSSTVKAFKMGDIILSNPSVSDGSFILPGTYKLGVATNNAEEFEVHAFGGDMGLGGVYGEIYVTGNSGGTAQSIGTTYSVIDQFDTNGDSNGVTLDAATNNTITVLTPGEYLICVTIAFSGTGSTTFDIAIHDNGTIISGGRIERKLGTGGDVGSTSLTLIHSAATNDAYDVRVLADGASKDFLVHEGVFCLTRIGG